MLARQKRRRLTITQLVWFGICVLAELPAASAHEGPPFPILMDKPLAGYAVSIWADPDIGEAEFYIIVETPAGGMPREAPRVSMWVEPVSGRLERATYEMVRQSLRNQMQFRAEPHFDQGDMWNIGFVLTKPNGQSQAWTTEIESTPLGYGPWDLVIYLFPFVFLGGMWLFALARRRRRNRRPAETRTLPADGSDPEPGPVESNVEDGA